MKRVLILVNRTAKNINSFYDGLKENFPSDVVVEIAHFEDVTIDIQKNEISVFVGEINLLDYDVTYFRRAGREFPWLASVIAIFLEYKKKIYFDSTYKEVGPRGTKLADLLKLAVNGFPVPPTFICHKDNILKNSEKIIAKFGLPLVAKDLHSQRGLGVFLIKEKKDIDDLLQKFPERKFLFQKFLDKKEEYRVLVLGDRIGSYERKTSTDPNEFRNNVALGAREDFLEIDQIADCVKDVSIRSAQTLKIEIAGVDIVVDSEDNIWILEVNMGPGFTYRSVVSNEVKNTAVFLVDQARGTK